MNRGELRVGVIGAGHWGWNIIRVCNQLGALASVCDPSPEMRKRVAAAYPTVHVFDSVDDLLWETGDAVIVAAPAELHAEIALKAIAAQKHVFVEKPFALSVHDAEQVARAATRSGLHVFAGHLLIYHPAVKRLRAIMAEGTIGRVWHVRSRRVSLGKLRHRESVWWSFAPHDVSLMLALMGEAPASVVAAQAGWLTSRSPDAAYADYQFSHGRSAHIEVSWLDPNKAWQLDVFGTEGVITLSESPDGTRMTLAKCGARSDDRGMLSTWRGEASPIPFDSAEPLHEEIVAFLTSLRYGIPAETDADEGLAVVRALALADRATHAAGAVEVNA